LIAHCFFFFFSPTTSALRRDVGAEQSVDNTANNCTQPRSWPSARNLLEVILSCWLITPASVNWPALKEAVLKVLVDIGQNVRNYEVCSFDQKSRLEQR
jgi:hypothetical protein